MSYKVKHQINRGWIITYYTVSLLIPYCYQLSSPPHSRCLFPKMKHYYGGGSGASVMMMMMAIMEEEEEQR